MLNYINAINAFYATHIDRTDIKCKFLIFLNGNEVGK